MTTTTPARRRLFTSPASSTKRRRVMTQTRMPKALMPEIKQYTSTGVNLLTTGLNTAYRSIPVLMSQGNDGEQFSGSKFRILRVRVYFDYSDVTTTSGVRLSLGIPKDPSDLTILSTGTAGTMLPHNMRRVTMLKETFLKTDGSNLNGYMEWVGPLNVEMSDDGTVPLKNNLILQINAEGVSGSLSDFNRTAIEVLFTG